LPGPHGPQDEPPLAWILTPANQPEFQAVTRLVDILYAYWPECPIEYLVGDRGFDVPDELHRDLEECYGIHPVTPWKRNGGRRSQRRPASQKAR
ncbi:MAG: hypothetical protein QOH72_2210, partial [Solirubrobacteraceae bacterium]|nr:hypothetical protein [Solirubrobacteraceae bacterium]